MQNLIRTIDLDVSNPSVNIEDLSQGAYKITKGGKTYILEILSSEIDAKKLTIRYQHTVYDIVFKDDLDLVLDEMGIKMVSENIQTSIKAPMPGKVLEVIAGEGTAVTKGQGILILEAMKMENVLKAESDCTIKSVLVAKGENVDKNQVLIELDFQS